MNVTNYYKEPLSPRPQDVYNVSRENILALTLVIVVDDIPTFEILK